MQLMQFRVLWQVFRKEKFKRTNFKYSDQSPEFDQVRHHPVMEDVVRTSTWFVMDGTFRITPRPGNLLDVRASQVLNITADYHGGVVLLFSVIMTSCKIGLYKRVFKFIRQHVPNFKPLQMMADYELAMRKGFRAVFPSAKYGCR